MCPQVPPERTSTNRGRPGLFPNVGGAIAEIEAYSYQDIDALVNIVWTDNPGAPTPLLRETFNRALRRCLQGGEAADRGGATGYVRFDPPDDVYRTFFFDAEEAVVDAAVAAIQKDPCGWVEHVVPDRTVNTARLAAITVPVLLLYPEEDPVFESSAQAEQERFFLGADDVTTIFLPAMGHVPMLERRAEDLRAALSDWLRDRGLVSRP